MRVFVLGAGASLHAGYPLAAQMGNCLAAWINTLPLEHRYRSRLEQVSELYGGLEDFERILADLMTTTPGSRASNLGVKPPYLLSGLKEALRDYFDSIRSAPAPLYDLLARVLRQDDVVITFNYDLGVERALRAAGLWDIGTGYGFAIEDAEQPSPVKVLKLHGSTNWRALLFGGRTTGYFAAPGNSLGDRPVLPFRPDLEYLGYTDFVDPLSARLENVVSLPAMIMPALPKTFHFATTHGKEWKEFWDALWSRAEQAIKNTDELAVIGYSLPVADERARAMLLESANKTVRLSICCGKATAALEQEFRDKGFTNIQTGTHTFEDFLTRETATACADAGETNLDERPHSHSAGTLARLNALTGKQGLLKIQYAGEVGFTILSVHPAPDLPAETDDEAIQLAINRSQFLVRFDEGTLIDGSDTRVISGRYISLIRGRY